MKGTLNRYLNKAVEQTKDKYAHAIENRMDPQEAWEAVRENHLLLPSEEDQPSLGEDPNPPDLGTRGTRSSRTRTFKTASQRMTAGTGKAPRRLVCWLFRSSIELR